MVMPDPVRFVKAVGNLIVKAAKAAKGEQPRVAVFGECAISCGHKVMRRRRFEVEKLCNQLAKTYDMDILCGYSLGSVQREQTATSSNESVQSIQRFIPGEKTFVNLRTPLMFLPCRPCRIAA